MKIILLGTGTSQGVPIIGCQCKVCRSADSKDHRLRSSVYIEHKGKSFVIDTGPDFRAQMLREHITHLDFLLFTHQHKDHLGGLDDIRAFNHLQKQVMDVYANSATCQSIRDEFPYAFCDNPYPGVPEIKLHTIGKDAFDVQGIHIIPIQLMHMHMPILGYRIDNFAYITDANYIAPEETAKLHGLDILILDALRKKKHYSHFNVEEALQLVNEIKPKRTYFTHISHDMGLHAQEDSHFATLPCYCRLGYDGLQLETEDTNI
ncbi:MAG: MBL fold metallo-hydrolase [Bacteroidales bacterium]|nr:MBL fold metallo-hydrolase [Bacteroidales bacterium]